MKVDNVITPCMGSLYNFMTAEHSCIRKEIPTMSEMDKGKKFKRNQCGDLFCNN